VVQNTHPLITKHYFQRWCFLVVFRVASKNVIYELSSSELSVTTLFFLHLWVQICLLRKFLAFCFSESHLRSPNRHLTMQFSHYKLPLLHCIEFPHMQRRGIRHASYPNLHLLLLCRPLNLFREQVNAAAPSPCRTHVAITSNPFPCAQHSAS
jgi:hypothetical protein